MRLIAHPSQWDRSSYHEAIVLCDEHTAEHCLPFLHTERSIVIPAGESSKQLDTCSAVWDQLLSLKARRSTTLICLGGGVVCDLGAFVASVYQRGMPYVLVPTSLLAMVDAAIGGKCGVDYQGYKNFIGLFAEADDTLIIPEFLKTLPTEELRNGRMEMIKHGLIHDRAHAEACISDRGIPDAQRILDSIRIKEYHTHTDPRETGFRKRLNYGHTVAHALESIAMERGAPMAHGLAVGLGMLAEARLSVEHWSFKPSELDLLEAWLLPLIGTVDPTWFNGDPMPYILMDKKNEGAQVHFTLLNHIGSAQENVHVAPKDIPLAFDYLRQLA